MYQKLTSIEREGDSLYPAIMLCIANVSRDTTPMYILCIFHDRTPKKIFKHNRSKEKENIANKSQ